MGMRIAKHLTGSKGENLLRVTSDCSNWKENCPAVHFDEKKR